jgi:hypothetical protein
MQITRKKQLQKVEKSISTLNAKNQQLAATVERRERATTLERYKGLQSFLKYFIIPVCSLISGVVCGVAWFIQWKITTGSTTLALILSLLAVAVIQSVIVFGSEKATYDIADEYYDRSPRDFILVASVTLITLGFYVFSYNQNQESAPITISYFKEAFNPKTQIATDSVLNSVATADITEQIKTGKKVKWNGRVTEQGQKIIANAQRIGEQREKQKNLLLEDAVTKNKEAHLKESAQIGLFANRLQSFLGWEILLVLVAFILLGIIHNGTYNDIPEDDEQGTTVATEPPTVATASTEVATAQSSGSRLLSDLVREQETRGVAVSNLTPPPQRTVVRGFELPQSRVTPDTPLAVATPVLAVATANTGVATAETIILDPELHIKHLIRSEVQPYRNKLENKQGTQETNIAHVEEGFRKIDEIMRTHGDTITSKIRFKVAGERELYSIVKANLTNNG